MGRYDDVLEFLGKYESTFDSTNQHTTMPSDMVRQIREAHPSLPNDYLDFLAEVGWGSFREGQYKVFEGLKDSNDLFDTETVESFGQRVLWFGENASGDISGYLPDDDWRTVEVWRDSKDLYETRKTFGVFLREQLLMDDDGNDMRRF